jgi:hypothetical protein
MNRRIVLAGIAAAITCFVTAVTVHAAPQSIAVPAYFYPSFPDPLWAQMENAVPAVSFAIMNPASGAGAMPDSNYVSQINQTRAAGVTILGYVTSSYAAADPMLVKADIDKYYTWYGVDGIFIDEASNDCMDQAYYADLDTYVKAKGGLGMTVINPGTITPECFATAADVILNFEGSYMQYLAWAPSGWEAGYDASKFWHLVYATEEADMPNAVLLSQARNAGYVYVTPDMLIPNPWDSLPGEPYWSTEIAYVQPTSGGCPAPVTKPKIKIRGLDTPEADDSLKFAGRFTLSGLPAIDPIADGVRLVLGDTGGVVADLTIAPGAYAGESGWSGSDGKWRYRDDSEVPALGITKIVLQAKQEEASTTVKFNVKGLDGAFAVTPTELPLDAAFLLDPADPQAECGEAEFPGPKPVCTATSDASTVTCR